MIRQAINCDMCGAEKVGSTSHWFVADEQGGEMRLRGWEAPTKGLRKSLKHLCGQKCVQRLMDNFTASLMAGVQVSKAAKEAPTESQRKALEAAAADPENMPVLERMGYDRETVALIEADSWAGPVRAKEPALPKEKTWGAESSLDNEHFVNVVRAKAQAARAFQRSA